MTQYLSEQDLDFDIDFDTIIPISTDSYVEEHVKTTVLSKNVEECFACALQFAIIGCGQKAYGTVKIHDQEYEVLELMIKNDIKYGLQQQTKLETGDLTLKRLARLFRFQIRDYIKFYNISSFLQKKYAPHADPSLTFPCAEYFITSSEAEGLKDAYKRLDEIQNTRFAQRIDMILTARNV